MNYFFFFEGLQMYLSTFLSVGNLEKSTAFEFFGLHATKQCLLKVNTTSIDKRPQQTTAS